MENLSINQIMIFISNSDWCDAWSVKYPNSPGFTYDGKVNKMLTNSLQNRLDRIFVKGAELKSIEVGTILIFIPKSP